VCFRCIALFEASYESVRPSPLRVDFPNSVTGFFVAGFYRRA